MIGQCTWDGIASDQYTHFKINHSWSLPPSPTPTFPIKLITKNQWIPVWITLVCVREEGRARSPGLCSLCVKGAQFPHQPKPVSYVSGDIRVWPRNRARQRSTISFSGVQKSNTHSVFIENKNEEVSCASYGINRLPSSVPYLIISQ